jgi:hypothetical protein
MAHGDRRNTALPDAADLRRNSTDPAHVTIAGTEQALVVSGAARLAIVSERARGTLGAAVDRKGDAPT